jgi:hypothetical protein
MPKKKLTQEEKQIELNWHRDVLLATLEYFIEHYEKSDNKRLDFKSHFLNLEVLVAEHFRKGRLTTLKQWFYDLTEGPRETGDLNYGRYIKEKTGHEVNIFQRFESRIAKVVERKKILTKNEYRDVSLMVDHLSQQTPLNENMVDTLNQLLLNFDKKSISPKAK